MSRQILLCFVLLACATAVCAQGPAINYQGKLEQNGVPLNGVVDLKFTVYTTSNGLNTVGTPVELADQTVIGGLFAAPLGFEFGVFNGSQRWLEVAVRPGDSVGAYTTLTPRQQVLAAPYATFAHAADGANITLPIELPTSSAGLVGYGFDNDTNTGIFSLNNNHLGLSTQGVERIRIDPNGHVGINTLTNTNYSLMVADSNHQIALRDTDDSSVWTLTTVSGGGFGVYQDGATQRLAINASGTVTVAGGKAVVYNNTGTQLMMFRMTATLTANLNPNQAVDGTLSWGNQGFASAPQVYVGGFTAGVDGPGNFERFGVVPHTITTTGCQIRMVNLASVQSSVSGGRWNLLIVGPR